MAIKWVKIHKIEDALGTDIIYEGVNTPFKIVSKKRHIEHAGRPGFWDHTTFMLVHDTGGFCEDFQTMTAAKEFAEAQLALTQED